MPARRKGYRRRHRISKRRNRLATKRFVVKQIRKDIETKFYDKTTSVLGTPDSVLATGTIYVLSTPIQGNTDQNRVGDKIRIRGLRIKGQFAIGDTTQSIRLTIMQYKQGTNLHAAAVNELYQAAYVNTLAAPYAPFTHDYKHIYTPLWDKTWLMDTVAQPVINFNIRVPMKYIKREVAFSAGSTDAINHLYLVAISDSTAVAHPTINFVSRLFYDDA